MLLEVDYPRVETGSDVGEDEEEDDGGAGDDQEEAVVVVPGPPDPRHHQPTQTLVLTAAPARPPGADDSAVALITISPGYNTCQVTGWWVGQSLTAHLFNPTFFFLKFVLWLTRSRSGRESLAESLICSKWKDSASFVSCMLILSGEL